MSPYVFVGLNALTLSFNLLVALAALGAPLLVLLLEISAEARSKVLYRKAAQHVSRAGLVFIIYFLLVAGAAMGMLISRFPALAGPWLDNPKPLLPALASLGVCLVAQIVCVATWKAWRKAKAAHMMVSTVGALSGLFSVVALTTLGWLVWTAPDEAIPTLGCADLWTAPLSSPLWPLTAQGALLAVTAAAGLGLIYVLSRRAKDDFGRDYYALAFRALTGWGAGFLVLQGTVHAWLINVSGLPPDGVARWTWLAALGTCGLALLCWLVVAKNEHPLRLKALVVLAALLLMAFVGLLLYAPLAALVLPVA